MAKTVLAFSPREQKELPFAISLSSNGALLFKCEQTGEFFKLPAGTTGEELKAYLKRRAAANEGQVSLSKALEALGLDGEDEDAESAEEAADSEPEQE